MAKKSKQKKVVRPKPSVSQRPTSHLRSIERVMNPKEKEVRVKTFIVERPVYIPSDRKFPARGYDAPEKDDVVYDPKKSRYAKKKSNEVDDDSFDDKVTDDDAALDDPDADMGTEDDSLDDTSADDAALDDTGGFSEEPLEERSAHPRGGIQKLLAVWWKRAIVFGIIWWLAVLAFILVLQTFNLVTVDINRGWWIFLGIIVALSIVYQKFLSGKF